LLVWTFSFEIASAVSGETMMVSSEPWATAAYRADTNGPGWSDPKRCPRRRTQLSHFTTDRFRTDRLPRWAGTDAASAAL